MAIGQIKWTKEEIDYLVESYCKCDWAELTSNLKRTRGSIGAKARELRLKRTYVHGNAWTKQEVKYITENSEKTHKELSGEIGRTVSAVRNKLQEIKYESNFNSEGDLDSMVKLSEIKVHVDKACQIKLKRAKMILQMEGKFVADYGRHLLFQKENGLKESFLKVDIATGRVEIKYN